ncbi:MAG: PEP-CTERM sorting domain-containing protein [Opitutaceae bacterium]|jgi:hypothetical protein|nr:PEP-CTERM sorting domain-containing protein [Opitutaceae bacterium]
MPSNPTLIRSALAACAFAAVTYSASAEVLYSQNFNEPNATTPLSSFSWTVFRGGSTQPSINSSGTTTGDIFNTERAAFLNINTTNASGWFAGLSYAYTGALPTTNRSLLSLSANVYAGGSVGSRGDVTLRIESSAGNWIGWTIPGTTLTSSNGIVAGGLLSSTTHSAGTFNASASSFNIILAFANTGTWGNDASNVIGIDNVTFQTVTPVPEPASAAALAGALVLGAVATRRRRR